MEQDNFIQRVREEITPEVIHLFGKALQDPEAKIQQDLQHILPTVILGIIEEGSTLRGARRISTVLNDYHPSVESSSRLSPKGSLEDGERVTEDLFGRNYYNFIKNIIPPSGLKTKNFQKLLSLLTPLILGVLKKSLPDKKPTPFFLYRFLKHQKKEQQSYQTFEAGENFRPRRQLPFFFVIILFFIISLSFFWLINRKYLSVSEVEGELKKVERLTSADSVTTIYDLSDFVSEGRKVQKGMRFYLPSVVFLKESTDFKFEGEKDLEILTEILQKIPRLTIRVLAASEDTGSPKENLRISEGRAMLIREELIGRGIEPSRIHADRNESIGEKPQVSIILDRSIP